MDNKYYFRLSSLPLRKQGIVASIIAEGFLRGRLLDLGFVPGTVVEPVRRSPLGDPTAYQIRGTVIALRSEEGDKILVTLNRKEAKMP
ncbi:MAG: FeoA family protein [Dethiobacteria bacterium]|jgi:ferrous iron transport protein A